jgi:NAD(P)-dependent dehydrogenase (short-subunit alcohol dehydrogenase family)
MRYDIEHRKVLITAGADGIGGVMARDFLEQGASVFVCDVSEEALTRFLSEHPKASGMICDVADEPAVGEMVAAAVAAMGSLDVLVNNAGIAGPIAALVDIEPDDWRRTIEVDLNSMFYTCRHAIPHIEAAGNGVIVNLSSIVGYVGAARRSPYAAAKSGVIGFSRALAVELGTKGIRVNSILPGVVDGARIRRTIERHAVAAGVGVNQMTEQYFAGNLLGQLQQPEEIAAMVLYLCSPAARSITGQAIRVDADHQTLK